MSSSRFLASAALAIFLLPSVAFASTSTSDQYQATLLQLITLLQQEVMQLEAQLATISTATQQIAHNTTPTVQATSTSSSTVSSTSTTGSSQTAAPFVVYNIDYSISGNVLQIDSSKVIDPSSVTLTPSTGVTLTLKEARAVPDSGYWRDVQGNLLPAEVIGGQMVRFTPSAAITGKIEFKSVDGDDFKGFIVSHG